MAVESRFLMVLMAFFDHTARNPKVTLDPIAVKNPNQLKDSSAAEANATPTMMGTSEAMTGKGVAVPKIICERITLKAGSRVFTVWVREIATAAKDKLAAT